MIEVGVAHAGHGGYDAPDAHKVYSIVVDFITPETDTSMWYFSGMARKFKPQDASSTVGSPPNTRAHHDRPREHPV
jgi:vanillate O-demethylase monooxygenase subunit